VALKQGGQVVCLDEEAALDFVRGRLAEAEVERLDAHVDQCDQCRVVLAEATRAFRERTTTATNPPRVPFTRYSPGDVLAERYRILRFIARGGMGEVYEAEDSILNARLALKTLAATISDDPHAIRRLKQEVNLARRITHPNVCRIFDLGVHDQPSGGGSSQGQLFITMELVPGRSLGESLRNEGRVNPARAVPIVHSMVAAIGAAHRAKVVHRDFKSDNVMLALDEGGAERVVVMDFGLARAALAADTSSIDGHSLAGTLPYMSPEQLEGKAVGPATDIYALGVVIFEMLTGQLPFKAHAPLAAAWKRMVEPTPPLASFVAGLDPSWQKLVTACLERDAAHRPSSVDELGHLLAHLNFPGSGSGGANREAGAPARLRIGPPLLATGLSVALAAGAVVAFMPSRDADHGVRAGLRIGLRSRPSLAVPAARADEPGGALQLPAQPSPRVTLEAQAQPVPTHGPQPMRTATVELPKRIGARGRSVQKHAGPAPPPPREVGEGRFRPGVSLPEASASLAPNMLAPAPAPAPVPETAEAAAAAAASPRRSTDPNDGFILQP
jgi:tRNA A-37 threonylcarbamoyl transferase component Bud32